MSPRGQRFLEAIGSGYALVLVNALYTLFCTPLILSYLGKDIFGLWFIVAQMVGLGSLFEVGLGAALGRNLIDHKSQINNGAYGSLIQTSVITLGIVAVCIGFLAYISSGLLESICRIPTSLSATFRYFFNAQLGLFFVNLLCKPFAAVLFAHQREALNQLSYIAMLIVSFGVLWIAFFLGWNINSIIISSYAGWATMVGFQALYSFHLKLFPTSYNSWGYPSLHALRLLFSYGFQTTLMGLGGLVVNASQVLVISATMGVASAATWVVATKTFLLGQQLVFRLFDFSIPALAEIYSICDIQLLKSKYYDIVSATVAIAFPVSIFLLVCNSSFVTVWTNGVISWNRANDCLLGLALIITATTRLFSGVAGITKRFGILRYAYIIQAIFFLPAAYFLSMHYGFPGILASIALSDLVIVGVLAGIHSQQCIQAVSVIYPLRWHMIIGFLIFGASYILTPDFSLLFDPMAALFVSVIFATLVAFVAFVTLLPRKLMNQGFSLFKSLLSFGE